MYIRRRIIAVSMIAIGILTYLGFNAPIGYFHIDNITATFALIILPIAILIYPDSRLFSLLSAPLVFQIGLTIEYALQTKMGLIATTFASTVLLFLFIEVMQSPKKTI